LLACPSKANQTGVPKKHPDTTLPDRVKEEKGSMQEFKDKVAVITGAASGIGYALAERCAQEGMKVVLAGINLENLVQAEKSLGSIGATTLCVQADVSKAEDIERLAHKTLDAFEAVHLLVNNAGVGAGGSAWESTAADWQWVMGVNLWGVIHGLQVFVPIMLAQDTACHIVNTSSRAGLLPYHPSAPYLVTKHAVVALSEQLYYALEQRNAKIQVSVLCPGWVRTKILECERNRPAELQNEGLDAVASPEREAVLQYMRQALEAGMSPEFVAERVFEAIRDEKFYIVPDPEPSPDIQARMESILQGRNPPALQLA
jgi:NAD(P)-dependent dehydrogenase (short-subunit alcohol dehydrogenase family)